MRNDQIFVLLLVVLLPMSGCFEGGVGEAEGQQETTTNAAELLTSYATITPNNNRCGDYDVCVWEYVTTINTSSTEGVEMVSVSTAIEGTYYEQYDNSNRDRITAGTLQVITTCANGHDWNNSVYTSSTFNSILPTVGSSCQHDFFVYGTQSGSGNSNSSISEIQVSMTWKTHSVNLV
jgi:hypothetical protein